MCNGGGGAIKNNIQLTLEQYKFEMHRSIYMSILFSTITVEYYIFSLWFFQIFFNCKNTVCNTYSI